MLLFGLQLVLVILLVFAGFFITFTRLLDVYWCTDQVGIITKSVSKKNSIWGRGHFARIEKTLAQ